MSDQLVLEGVEPPPPAPDFAALRNELGWSVEEVADKLKISVAKVRAIEKLDFAALPDGPYTRGFIRNYARLLSADPSPWLNLMDAAPPAHTRVVRDDPRRLPKFDDTGRNLASSARLMWLGVALLVVAMLLFLAWWERSSWLPAVQALLPGQQTAQPSPVPEGSAPASPPAAAAGSVTTPVEIPTSAGAMGQTGSAVSTAAPADVAAAPSTASPASTPAVEAARLEVPAGHKSLALSFKSDAWVEVRDASGKMLVSQLNKAGSQTSFTGQPPLRFTVGAAKDVALLVDGKNFDMAPYLRNDVARFVVN
jgi:cytoskeleton protein RodZ